MKPRRTSMPWRISDPLTSLEENNEEIPRKGNGRDMYIIRYGKTIHIQTGIKAAIGDFDVVAKDRAQRHWDSKHLRSLEPIPPDQVIVCNTTPLFIDCCCFKFLWAANALYTDYPATLNWNGLFQFEFSSKWLETTTTINLVSKRRVKSNP